jgi:D-lactate dehydrogenase|tara:strand:+ start:9295 stop:10986 length:1692 start_codon:yes stop_codon:yes gene_type:complete
MKEIDKVLNSIKKIVGNRNLIVSDWDKEPFLKGWRYGEGKALAVVKPEKLIEMWEVLELCVKNDLIIIMQAANTGLTGGSTPDGKNYDREIIIINTINLKDIHVINDGKQIIGFAGSTLYDLEKKIKKYGREPHSVIGSTSIGASITGGICNNSGGSLVHRGPAYTQLALYAKINESGKLELINELDVNLGSNPKEIFKNLEEKKYDNNDIIYSNKLASDNKYSEIVRDINSNIPARFNSDKRLLYGVSGSAGKVAVFAVRVDTYPKPKESQVFFLGSNNVDVFWKLRRHILLNFKTLPRLGDYMHRDCYDAAKKYSKDSFIVIEKLGTKYLPILFKFKRVIDLISKKINFLPNKLSDRVLQFLSLFWPNHLPKKMESFRDQYEHLWIIEMTDNGIDEAEAYFKTFFNENDGSYFKCNNNEAKKAQLHRYVSAGAFGRYQSLKNKSNKESFSMDIALPRNEKKWFEKLPEDINDLFEIKLYYGHLFCHVMHQNYVVKKGVDTKDLLSKLLEFYESRGAEYPAEHNVGHEYSVKSSLFDFYKKLDPTNSFNPGIGKTSKLKNWK